MGLPMLLSFFSKASYRAVMSDTDYRIDKEVLESDNERPLPLVRGRTP